MSNLETEARSEGACSAMLRWDGDRWKTGCDER
jgi:hypothetical protein